MTPDHRIERLEAQLQHLQALVLTQTAEIQSLLALQPLLLLESGADGTIAERVQQLYAEMRTQRLQKLLLQLEQNQPGLAARLSEILDHPALNFPLRFE
jgi:hypothetical protein